MTSRWDGQPPEPAPEPKPKPDKVPTPKDLAQHMYSNIRNDIVDLEEYIECAQLSEDDIKSLDKAVTLLKVGSKYIKKYLKRKGRKTKVLVRA